MPAALPLRRIVPLYLLVWLILSVVFAALVGAAAGFAWPRALWFAVPVTMVYAVASGFSAFYLCRAFPLTDRAPVAILAVFVGSALVAGALWTALCTLWNTLLSVIGNSAGMPMSNTVLGMIFGVGALLYGLAAVANYLAIEFGRARSAERRELEAALMARTSELRLLRAQVDPHFLFNSLNSISALTSIDPARARTMTLSLADFFRHTLGLQADAMVPLGAEVTLALRFLSIEQVRFGARLQVGSEIDPAAAECLVPPMLLQPLVENSVKHGIAAMTKGGAVHLSARRAGSQLFIKVCNDVDSDVDDAIANKGGDGWCGAPGPVALHAEDIGATHQLEAARDHATSMLKPTRGIGLANVRQRLAADFAHEASLHCVRRDGRFEVELMLPAVVPAMCPGSTERVCVS